MRAIWGRACRRYWVSPATSSAPRSRAPARRSKPSPAATIRPISPFLTRCVQEGLAVPPLPAVADARSHVQAETCAPGCYPCRRCRRNGGGAAAAARRLARASFCSGKRRRRSPAFLCRPSVSYPQSSHPTDATHMLLQWVRQPPWLQVEVNGASVHPVYHFLKAHTPEDRGGSGDIDWNFAKWVVDKHVRCPPEPVV